MAPSRLIAPGLTTRAWSKRTSDGRPDLSHAPDPISIRYLSLRASCALSKTGAASPQTVIFTAAFIGGLGAACVWLIKYYYRLTGWLGQKIIAAGNWVIRKAGEVKERRAVKKAGTKARVDTNTVDEASETTADATEEPAEDMSEKIEEVLETVDTMNEKADEIDGREE